ncbi:MAG: hypothetical protein C0594_05495 [Marinilabiliales bacterium]|nr:MAG: hypothetical protein C0594_05495 [Marinilabiliales bacterium]
MKQVVLFVAIFIMAINSYAQFGENGFSIGWQFTSSKLNNAYSNIATNDMTVVALGPRYEYNDKFMFHMMDLHYTSVSEDMLFDIDYAVLPASVGLLTSSLQGKDHWINRGKLKEIETNAPGTGVSGTGVDWSAISIDLAGGGNGFLVGLHWNISAVGVYNLEDSVGGWDLYRSTTWRNIAYNTLGLGLYYVNDFMIVSLRSGWIRTGMRNGFEAHPEIKANIGKYFYASGYYRYRTFENYESEELNLHKMTSSTLGLRVGVYLGDNLKQ